MKLNKKLEDIKTYPFHMPGHKRNKKFNIISSNIDITEIDGYDNLHNPQECLLELENRCTKLYNSKKSILSVNGSTCCILSAISAVCSPNDKIIIARNCHKSVYNACYIRRLKIEYIIPSINSEFNCFNPITQDDIDNAIKNNPDAKAIVLTSPTYEGIVSNVKSPIPLIIDSAHGAHFGFSDNFPKYPNADIVISSLHKTLPALTQTAIVNIYNDKYIKSVKRYMDIYETSSPSYVLLNSIDICADFLENSKTEFDKLYSYSLNLRKSIEKLKTYKVLNNDDISRLCIKSLKLNGNDFANVLRNEYNIEVEMSCNDYIILILTVGDDEWAFNMLYKSLKEIDCKYQNYKDIEYKQNDCISKPIKECESHEIESTQLVDSNKCTNLVCAEYIYAYPPGIPIIVPGEIITDSIIKTINTAISNGTNIISDSGFVKDKILTKW